MGSAIFHLRNISRIRRYVTAAATEPAIHTFLTSRFDVDNALLHRLPLKQKAQNCVARLIDGAMKCSHATPLLIRLPRLPTAVLVELKSLPFTHIALNGHAHEYIEHYVSRRQPATSLRSSELFMTCATHKASMGRQSFQRGCPESMACPTATPTVTYMTPDAIKTKLKTYQFK